jgi:poly-gamma-glutamate synthesis protein (capsule biosynthesis protein)
MRGFTTLRVVGDIMLGGSVHEKTSKFGPSFPFKRFSGEIKPADIFFGNLECTLFDSKNPPEKNKVLLKSDPSVIRGLKDSGINIVSLANNHSFDFGLDAYLETKRILERNGIKCIGGGKNLIEASKYTLFKVDDCRFGFLAYCSQDASCRRFADHDSYGVASVDPEKICQDIKRTKGETDFVIVSLHWGKEFRDYPCPEQIEIARSFIKSGATLVVGSHTHVFQGYEKYKNGLIIYDLGSFIFGDILIDTPTFNYKYCLRKRKTKEGIMVECIFNQKGLVDYKFDPILINSDFQVTIPRGFGRQRITRRFKKQSKRITSRSYEFFYSNIYLSKIEAKAKLSKFYQFIKASLKRIKK